MDYNPPVGIDELILRHMIISKHSHCEIFFEAPKLPEYELIKFKTCAKARHRQSSFYYGYYKALESPKFVDSIVFHTSNYPAAQHCPG